MRAIPAVQSCTKPPALERKKCKFEKKREIFSLLHVGVRAAAASLPFHATTCLRWSNLLPDPRQLCSSLLRGGCVPVEQPGLRVPARGAPARAAARARAPGGWPGLPLPLVEGERGSLLLGRPLPRRGRLGRQVFGRGRVLLNAAQGACHAAPAGARSARRLLHTRGEAWEKSLWLKGSPARFAEACGKQRQPSEQELLREGALRGAKSECRHPVEGGASMLSTRMCAGGRGAPLLLRRGLASPRWGA